MRVVPHADVVVVGAGPAGLAFAYRLLLRRSGVSLVVLERADVPGGRTRMANFHGAYVYTGAGVGRLGKDVRLLQLLQDLGVPFSTSAGPPAGGTSSNDTEACLRELYAARLDGALPGTSFRDFAVRVLGLERYRRCLVEAGGFSDFELADARDTLLNYGLDDLLPLSAGRPKFFFDWNALSSRLVEEIRRLGGEVRFGAHVTDLSDGDRTVSFRTSSRGTETVCADSAVVLAVPASAARTLLRRCRGEHGRNARRDIRHIRSQPFALAYAHVAAWHGGPPPSALTAVRGPLQKVAPTNAPDVFLVGYADNANAEVLREHAGDTAFFQRELRRALRLRAEPQLTDLRVFYWRDGTHYMSPLPARGPRTTAGEVGSNWILCVGEAYGEHRGWTEGALQSVGGALDSFVSCR